MSFDKKDLARLFKKEGYEIYLVGGCVRDMIMGITPHDYDFCTNATPKQMNRLCSKYHLFHTNVGEKYGTVNIYLDDKECFEITTYRKDGQASDSRHPDNVTFSDSIEADLSRRDFTINAIAMDPITEEIIDPFHGKDDIKNKILRCVDSPDRRFEEDELRVLRGLRFAIKYGLTIDPKTSDAMLLHTDISHVSKERKTDELRKIMTNGAPAKPYFLKYRNILANIFPGLEQCFDFEQRNKWHKHDVYEHMASVYDACASKEFPTKLAALLHDIGKPNSCTVDENGFFHFYGHPEYSRKICENIVKHLTLTKEEEKAFLTLVEIHDVSIKADKKTIRRLLNKYGPEMFEQLIALRAADRSDHNILEGFRYDSIGDILSVYNEIKEEEACFSLKNLAISGIDLMNYFSIHPGKEVGTLLNTALNAVMEERVPNTKENILEFLEKQRDLQVDNNIDIEL